MEANPAEPLRLPRRDIPGRCSRLAENQLPQAAFDYEKKYCICHSVPEITPSTSTAAAPIAENKHLLRWVEKMAELDQPDRIHWVDGSQAGIRRPLRQMVENGTFTQAQSEALAGLLLRPLRCPAMWPAWKTAPSSARSPKTTPARPTTGKTRSRCAAS